jgi:putative phosphoesterase
MKLGILSDLHIDNLSNIIKRNVAENTLIDFIKNSDIDILLIPGDLSSDWVYTVTLIDSIQDKTGVQIYFVPGNHDLWHLKKETNKVIEGLSHHPSVLINRFVTLNDNWDLYGALGWYDYSFKSSFTTDQICERKKKSLWADSEFMNLEMSDKEFFQKQLNSWKGSFETHSGKNTIFMQHFVPSDKFLTYKENSNDWNFCNAYIGSEKIRQFIESKNQIKVVPFGHTHNRFGEVEMKGVKYMCNPLGYHSEWTQNDFAEELNKIFVSFEI